MEWVNDLPAVLVLDQAMETAERVSAAIAPGAGPAPPVRWCDTIQDVLDVVARGPVRLLISEVTLDGEDISGGLRRLRDCHPEVGLMIFSSAREAASLVDLLDDGCPFVSKAVSREQLARSLKAAVYRPQPWWGAPLG